MKQRDRGARRQTRTADPGRSGRIDEQPHRALAAVEHAHEARFAFERQHARRCDSESDLVAQPRDHLAAPGQRPPEDVNVDDGFPSWASTERIRQLRRLWQPRFPASQG